MRAQTNGNRCANPGCTTEMKGTGDGSHLLVARDSSDAWGATRTHAVTALWFCDECARLFTAADDHGYPSLRNPVP
jgi:hypothetical protein